MQQVCFNYVLDGRCPRGPAHLAMDQVALNCERLAASLLLAACFQRLPNWLAVETVMRVPAAAALKDRDVFADSFVVLIGIGGFHICYLPRPWLKTCLISR